MSDIPRIRLLRIRDVGQVLRATAYFLRQNARVLARSLLFIAAPAGALSFLFSALLQASFRRFDAETMAGADLLGASYLGAAVFGLLSTALSVLVVHGFMALYEVNGPDGFDVNEVWDVVRRRFLPVLTSVLLLALMVMLPSFIVAVPCLGLAAYLVGLVYLVVVYAPIFPMRVCEDVGLLQSLRRSHHLVRHRWAPTAGVLLASTVVFYLLSLVINLPALVLLFASGIHEGALSRWPLLAAALLGGAMTTLLQSIPLTALGFQYFSLRAEEAEAAAAAAAAPEG